MTRGSLLSQRGVLRLLRNRFSVSHVTRKDANAVIQTQGRPYKQLSIGVPKEIWQNEKRLLLFFFLL